MEAWPLFHRNGTVVARWPQAAQLDSQQAVLDAAFARRLHAVHGDFVGAGPMAGVERLYSYRQVLGCPLVTVVGRSLDDALPRGTRAWEFSALVIAMDIAILTLTLL